jgi:flagellar biosynthetic protein FliO
LYSEFDIVSIKTILSLIIILGLIISLFFVLKKFRLGSVYKNRFPVMRTIGSLSLAPKRAIALVEVCGQYFIIGIGTENVSLISRLEFSPDDHLFNGRDKQVEGKFQSLLEIAGLSRKKPGAEKKDII